MTRRRRRAHLFAGTALLAAAVVLAVGGPLARGQEDGEFPGFPSDVELEDEGGLSPPGGQVGKTEHVYQPPTDDIVEQGEQLFVQGCSYCHALDARGVPGRGPNLRGVGARAAHFYLTTGRMPLQDVGEQPTRSQPAYDPEQIRALIAYIASFGGPPIPDVHPERGSLPEGFTLYGRYCMPCHQVNGEGGVMPGALAPPLQNVDPTHVAEAIRIGPWVMPSFGPQQLTDEQIDSIARFVLLRQSPIDAGGWGIGHIGPVAEGMVTAFIGLLGLVLVTRALGERTTE